MARDSTTTRTSTHALRSGGVAHSLSRLAEAASLVDGVWEKDVAAGDFVVVRTLNSVYTLAALGGGIFTVAGGWFKARHADGTRVRVTGCTWGGHAILIGLVAAPGMCLEFDNGVQTTRIREVKVMGGAAGSVH